MLILYFYLLQHISSFHFLYIRSDIDECNGNLHKCHENAMCNNTIGAHNCTCNNGYEGNGFNCTGTWLFVRIICMCQDHQKFHCPAGYGEFIGGGAVSSLPNQNRVNIIS